MQERRRYKLRNKVRREGVYRGKESEVRRSRKAARGKKS